MSGLTTRVNTKTTFDSKESLFLMGVGALTCIWGGHSPPVYLPFVAVYWSLKLDKTFLRDGATHLHLRGALTSICGACKGISAFNITLVMKYESIFAFPIIINNEMVQEVAIRNSSLKKTFMWHSQYHGWQKEPGHQHPWYWPCSLWIFNPQQQKGILIVYLLSLWDCIEYQWSQSTLILV